MSIDNIRRYQDGADNLLLKYLGGVDGVRCLTGKLLAAMEPPHEYSFPPQMIRIDAIEYLVEVIQCNVIGGLEKALLLAVEMLMPGDGYPTVTRRYVRDLGSCCSDIYRGRLYHKCTRMFRPMEGILSLWEWPEHDCLGDEFLGEEERRKLVRALAYRAGIVKMSGDAFSFISTVILHEMAVLMSHASDMCYGDGGNSHTTTVAAFRYLGENDERVTIMMEAIYSPIVNDLVITPNQIKDAAKSMGMQPILFGFGCSDVEWDGDEFEGEDSEYFPEVNESDDTLEFDFDEFESDPDSDEVESDTESYDTALEIRNDGLLL